MTKYLLGIPPNSLILVQYGHLSTTAWSASSQNSDSDNCSGSKWIEGAWDCSEVDHVKTMRCFTDLTQNEAKNRIFKSVLGAQFADVANDPDFLSTTRSTYDRAQLDSIRLDSAQQNI